MTHRNIISYAARFCFILLLAASTVSAFQRISRAEDRSQHLKGLLSLTEDQTKQVYAILTNHEANPTDGKETGSRRMNAKAERIRRAAVDKEIEALLTPDQLNKYASYKKARRSETDTRRRPRGGEYQ